MGIAKQGNDCEDIQHSTQNGKSQDTNFDTLFHMWIIVMIYLVCKGPIQNEVECFRIDYKPEVASVLVVHSPRSGIYISCSKKLIIYLISPKTCLLEINIKYLIEGLGRYIACCPILLHVCLCSRILLKLKITNRNVQNTISNNIEKTYRLFDGSRKLTRCCAKVLTALVYICVTLNF